ncbi:guanine nucleotide binding protein, alpha subunit [Pterulicium gracile]|uniref:Guanine nucleotide binding protein, alpha subunit n=1 Tax=Pterulicium gracile TaxID=1884261 RepID=A0A5C3Q254_9AGAR|nr:guanine nucleotide binding protein, alpha subunit [Pterula gracilis]
MPVRSPSPDPFSSFLAPPPNESPASRTARLASEAEDRRVSQSIDDGLREERAMIRRREKEVIKVLLLGQADSGKSTTLKNFRMKYAKEAWRTERASWRAAILLNVVKALVNILHALSTRPVHSSLETPTADLSPTTEQPPSPSNLTPIDNNPFPTAMLSEPLVRLERELKMHLGPASEEIGEFGMDEGIRCPTVTSPTSPTVTSPTSPTLPSSSSSYASPTSPTSLSPQHQPHDETNIHLQTPTPCDIPRSPPAQEHLGRRVLGIDTVLDGLLTDLSRVTSPDYVPTDDDIICCRLRTTGVTEYALTFPTGMDEECGVGEWIMYDVGGARTNRYAWQSYFENVNAIIFLAPISCFDERLLEDTRINRLEDSFLLWKSIVSSRFFVKTTMVVFLNKVDILRRKLEEGRMVNKFLPSYGTRENEWKVVVKYLRDKFKEMSRQFSPQPRVVYLYSTSVINTKATSQTLKSVRDGILREHLVSAELA